MTVSGGCTVAESDGIVEGLRQLSLSLALQATPLPDLTKSSKTGFLNLPAEVVERIVVELCGQPRSIAALARTCRPHRVLIYEPADSFLWREIFLTGFDDPRRLSNRHRLHTFKDDFDWGHAFRERIWADKYLGRIQSSNDGKETPMSDEIGVERALSALTSLIDTASPISLTALTITDYMPGGKTYAGYWTSLPFVVSHRRCGTCPPSPELTGTLSLNMTQYHTAMAQGFPAAVHTKLTSTTVAAEWDESPLARAVYKAVTYNALISQTQDPASDLYPLIPVMPSLVLYKRAYDLGRFRRSRMYGPFLPSEPSPFEWDVDPEDCFAFEVDWPWLAAAALIMRNILDSGMNSWMPDYRLGADALRPGAWIPPRITDELTRDWAGVEGMWRRLETWLSLPVVQALNGESWHEVTESHLANRARHLVPCRLHIVSYSQDPGCPSAFPTIHFEGDTGMEGWYDRESLEEDDESHVCFVEGTVSMLADGCVRWSFHMHHGRTRESGRQWSFEGVQIGGIGSLAGILGMWRGADTMGFWWQWKVA